MSQATRRSELLILMGLPPDNNYNHNHHNRNSTISSHSPIHRCINYATLKPNWDAVRRHLIYHPEQASICDIPTPSPPSSQYYNNNIFPAVPLSSSASSSTCQFSPLYIALRNEILPVPLSVVELLLQHSTTNMQLNHQPNINMNMNMNNMHNINDLILNDDTIIMSCRNPTTTSSIMTKLLSIKPTFPQTKYHWYTTPLHAIAKNGNSVHGIKAFIDYHPKSLFKVDAIDDGRIPLHIACGDNGLPEVVELFIRQGIVYNEHDVSNVNGNANSNANSNDNGNVNSDENDNGGNTDNYDNKDGEAKPSGKRYDTINIGGGLFKRDALGMTPIHCALYRLKYLEECRGVYTSSGGSGGDNKNIADRNACGKKTKSISSSSSSSHHWYLNSMDYNRKCYNAWKVLNICIIYAAKALKEKASSSKRRRNMHDYEYYNESKTSTSSTSIMNNTGDLDHFKIATRGEGDIKTSTSTQAQTSFSSSLHAALDLLSMEPNMFTPHDDHNIHRNNQKNTFTSTTHHNHLNYNDLFHLLLHPQYCNRQQLASKIDPTSSPSSRLPFHKAITNKHLHLQNGLQYILESYPEALLSINNLHSGIIPQLMETIARNNEVGGLSMVFDLIKNAPLLLLNTAPSIGIPNPIHSPVPIAISTSNSSTFVSCEKGDDNVSYNSKTNGSNHTSNCFTIDGSHTNNNGSKSKKEKKECANNAKRQQQNDNTSEYNYDKDHHHEQYVNKNGDEYVEQGFIFKRQKQSQK